MVSDLLYRLRALFRRNSVEAEMDEELRAHLEHQVEKYVQSGMSREEAERRAKLEFGGLEQIKEECRDSWGVRVINELAQDVRYGLRQLRRNPGFTTIAILTLALGIGANTALFSVVDAVLLHPLPYREPDHVAYVYPYLLSYGVEGSISATPADFLDWKTQNNVFEDMAAGEVARFDLTGGTTALHVTGVRVTTNLFSVLGIRPVLGRTFGPSDATPGQDKVVVLGYGLWQKACGSRRDILGKTIWLNGESFVVVGVMPPSFRFPYYAQNDAAFLPLAFNSRDQMDRTSRLLSEVVARLKPGVTFAQAQVEMKAIEDRLRKTYPQADKGIGAWVEPLGRLPWVWRFVKPLFVPLYAAAICVLAVGCVNLVNLLLARGIGREHEVAIRAALGAGRRRLIRQLVTEGMLLSVLGGAAGITIAAVSVRVVKALIPPNRLPNIQGASLDLHALFFALTIALITGAAFSIIPAWRTSQVDPRKSIQQGGRTSSPAAGVLKVRGMLLLTESALALLLLFGAGVVLQAFTRLMRTDPGFNPRHLLSFAIDINHTQYPKSGTSPLFFERVADNLRSLPGVMSVAISQGVPGTDRQTVVQFALAGRSLPQGLGSGHQGGAAAYERVSPGYFKTLQDQLEKGRYFTPADNVGSPRVAIVTDALVRHDFPDESVLGKLITVRSLYGSRWTKTMQVVGIVRAIRQYSLSQAPLAMIYVPQRQDPDNSTMIVLRTKQDPRLLIPEARRRVAQVTSQPIYDVRAIRQRYETIASFQHADAVVFSGFALITLLLAGVGIYGVGAFGVSRRYHEIGIRMALGATKGQMLRMIVRQTMYSTLLGAALGCALLPAFKGLLSAMLGTGTHRLATSMRLQGGLAVAAPAGAAALFVLAVGLLACYIPARRAANVDPMEALRYE